MIKLAVHFAEVEPMALTCGCGWSIDLLEPATPAAINIHGKTVATEALCDIDYKQFMPGFANARVRGSEDQFESAWLISSSLEAAEGGRLDAVDRCSTTMASLQLDQLMPRSNSAQLKAQSLHTAAPELDFPQT